MKKDKEETNENDDDNKQQKNPDARKVHADAEKTEDLPKNHEKGSETVNFDNQEKQARCRAQAAIWYEDEGFERIQAIRKTLESENRNRFSVNREGICSISIGKRKYRRVGILKGYPFGQTEVCLLYTSRRLRVRSLQPDIPMENVIIFQMFLQRIMEKGLFTQ